MDQQVAAIVLDVLQEHGNLPRQPGWTVEVAPGGSTDRTFAVLDQAGTRQLTARLARPGLTDWLRQEAQVLADLERDAPSVWSPRQVALIEDDRLPEGLLLVHGYLPGQPTPLADSTLAGREQIGECLAWLHGHRRTTYTIWPSQEARSGTRADAYHARLGASRQFQSAAGVLPGTDELIERLSAAALPPDAGWAEQDFALCHGDLSIGNILWNGDDLALIDWEFARYADPAEEIAYLVAEQQLSPDLVGDIAETYVGAGGDPWAFARLPTWLPLVALDAALWWADHHLTAGTPPATVVTVTERIARARNYLGLRND